jgi:hypothetical protein
MTIERAFGLIGNEVRLVGPTLGQISGEMCHMRYWYFLKENSSPSLGVYLKVSFGAESFT